MSVKCRSESVARLKIPANSVTVWLRRGQPLKQHAIQNQEHSHFNCSREDCSSFCFYSFRQLWLPDLEIARVSLKYKRKPLSHTQQLKLKGMPYLARSLQALFRFLRYLRVLSFPAHFQWLSGVN